MLTLSSGYAHYLFPLSTSIIRKESRSPCITIPFYKSNDFPTLPHLRPRLHPPINIPPHRPSSFHSPTPYIAPTCIIARNSSCLDALRAASLCYQSIQKGRYVPTVNRIPYSPPSNFPIPGNSPMYVFPTLPIEITHTEYATTPLHHSTAMLKIIRTRV